MLLLKSIKSDLRLLPMLLPLTRCVIKFGEYEPGPGLSAFFSFDLPIIENRGPEDNGDVS